MQPRRDRDGSPVSERHGHPAALATRSPSVATRHFLVGCGLVQKHEPIRIEVGLTLEPGQARRLHVLPILLGGVAGVFLRVMPWSLKKRDRLLAPTAGCVRPVERSARAETNWVWPRACRRLNRLVGLAFRLSRPRRDDAKRRAVV